MINGLFSNGEIIGGNMESGLMGGKLTRNKPSTNIFVPKFYFDVLSLQPALWLNANDSSTITLESGAVSEWRDKSGNNRHASQSTASNRPLFSTNKISFSTTSQLNFSCPQTINSTVFFVASTASMSGYIVFLNRITSSTPFPPGIYFNTDQNTFGLYWGNSSINSNFNIANKFDIFSVKFTPTNITFRSSINVSTVANNQTVLSTWNEIHNSSTQNTSFDLYSLIIINREITQAERELVEGYLAWSTGLTGNLPEGHPYK